MKTVLEYLQRRIDELKEQEKQYLANGYGRYARYAKEDLKEFENAVKNLTIPDVSQQRELLINLVKYIQEHPISTNILDHGKFIDEYISKLINCG